MPVHEASNRPRRTGYTFANQGAAASGNQGGTGKHVLRRQPGVDFWSPSWGEETVIRPYPALDPFDSTKFDPYRLSTDPCDFGDWIRSYEAVRNFGNPGVTMLLHDGLSSSYDAQLMNPCWILYRAINQALSQGQGMAEWVPLTKGSTGKGPVLSKPSKLYLVQCAIFRHKSQNTFAAGKPPIGASPDGPTIVMGLPPTAGDSLIALLEEKAEDWKGNPDDMAQYKYGDMVSIEEGGFVHIYELGKDPRQRLATRTASAASIYTAAPKGSRAGAALEAKGYGVFITKTLDGGEHDMPAAMTGFEELVRNKFKPWNSILEFKSDVDQAHLIAPLFPSSAVMYAWRDHPSWIPENVRAANSFETRQPVSASAPPSNPWGGGRKATPPQAPPVQTDNVVPSEYIDEEVPESESLAVDPLVAEAEKIKASRAKLEEATAKAASRRAK